MQIQAFKFNSAYTVYDFLIPYFQEIASDNEYHSVKYKKYINRLNNSHFIFVFLNNNDEIFYIKNLRDGAPQTAFDCLVALKFHGDDYVAALDIYRKFYTNTAYPTPLPSFAASYPIYPTFQPSAYGIAGWMKFEEYLENDLFSDAGIPIGLVESHCDNTWYRLYYSDERHLITVAPNGTGKGTCTQRPVLLQYDAPMLVIDPKGENAAVTAKYRKEGMKHDVLILNPFNVLDKHFASEGFKSKKTNKFESACFNPLAALNPKDDSFVSDVASLSEALIESNVNEPFWPDSARELVNCLILFICTSEDYKDKRNLIQMRRLLTQNTNDFKKTMEIIAASDFAPMAQKARRLIDDNRTNQSIILNAISQTCFLDIPILAKNLVSNDIECSLFLCHLVRDRKLSYRRMK